MRAQHFVDALLVMKRHMVLKKVEFYILHGLLHVNEQFAIILLTV